MKNVRFVVVFFFLALIALGKNDEVRSLPPVPPNVKEWTLAEAMPSTASIRGQVKLASAPPSGLPDHLAIGSRDELRKYIVGKNQMEMNVWLTGQYYNQTSYSQIKIGKWSDGYSSFEEFLSDAGKGIEALIPKIQVAQDYRAGTDVGFSIAVTYFNSHVGVPSALGLSLPRKQGTRDTLTASKVIDSFRSFQTNDFERLIVPVPSLKKLEFTLVLGNGQVGTLIWNKDSGAKLASWPKTQPEPITDIYFGMSSWLCEASYQLRLKLTPEQGGVETYTQYGDRLSLPIKLEVGSSGPQIIAPKGADVDVLSSSNLVNWSLLKTVTNSLTPINVGGLGPKQFFKVTVW